MSFGVELSKWFLLYLPGMWYFCPVWTLSKGFSCYEACECQLSFLPHHTQFSPKGLIYQEIVVAGANIIQSPTLIHFINADWINNSSRCVTCQWHEPILCVTIPSSSSHGGIFFTINIFHHGKEPLLICNYHCMYHILVSMTLCKLTECAIQYHDWLHNNAYDQNKDFKS